MKDRYFVDTNILVYAHDLSSPHKQKISQSIIKDGIMDDCMVISTQVLLEFFVVATKKIGLTFKDTKRIMALLGSASIVEINYSMIIDAMKIHRKYKYSIWDSLIIISAERADCKILFTEDLTANQKIRSVIIKNPF